MTQLVGCIFHSRYRIESLLARQTGRRTCLATDLRTGASVVIKLLLFGPDFTWSDLKLFEREAAVLKSLDHEAIPKYLDSFEVETELGKGFALVQSYIEAKSLQQWMQSGRTFSESELKAIAISLLKTLDYLHQRHPNVVHRDVKPSNILLSDHSWWNSGRIHLVDFGSVQTVASSGTRTVVGTYGYMPPEQFGGQTLPASDLYALGVTLIHLASGQSPDQLPQREMRLLFENHVRLDSHWINWLRWLTEPSLDRRAVSAKQALKELEPSSKSPVSASSPLPVQPAVSIVQPQVLERPEKSLLSGESTQPLATQPVKNEVEASSTKDVKKASNSVIKAWFWGLGISFILPVGVIMLLSRPSVESYLADGDDFYQQQNYDRAIENYTQALKLDPNNVGAYVKRGETYEIKKDYDHAIADYNQILKLDPKNIDAYNDRGNAFNDKQDYDRAQADFNQVLQLDSKNAYAYNGRGIAFYYKQDYDRAMTDYNQVLKLDPKYSYAYNNRGLVYEARNSHAAAMADFDQALKLDPNCVDAYISRGFIFAHRQDYDRAMVNYNQALRLDPKNVGAYFDRGETHLDQGSYEAAIADFNRALEHDSDYTEAYYFRGLANKNVGCQPDALADLEKFVSLTHDVELKQKAQTEILRLRSVP